MITKNVLFKRKIAHVRYADDKINMITFRVPFGELPNGAKFRYGTEQDDFEFIKMIANNKAYTNQCPGSKLVHKVKKNKIVLIDFFMYYF